MLLRRLTVVTLAVTYALVAVGGLVRATESGLGCGDDWPRCSGRVIPEADHHAWIEFTHRFIALVVVGLTIALAVTAWRRARERRDVVRLAVSTVPIVLAQAGLGAVVVILELHAESVVAHLALAMTLLAVLLALLVRQVRPQPGVPQRLLSRAVPVVALLALATMLLGSYVSGREAGLAFTDWPLFDGRPVPTGRGSLGLLHGIHRLVALASGVALAWLVLSVRSRTDDHDLRRLVGGAAALFAVQVVVGAANIWTDLSAATRTIHLAVAAAIWALLAAATFVARRPAAAPVPEAPRESAPPRTPGATGAATSPRVAEPAPAGASAIAPPDVSVPTAAPMTAPTVATTAPSGVAFWLGRARIYFLLTKPRVIELLLVTTVPAMVLADGGLPSPWLVLAVLTGGAMAAGGANTVNCYIDRDRDRSMRRTHHRPLPSGDVSPRAALWFGVVLELLAFAWLWATANLLAAALAVSATLFYVFVYSIWLKPRTAQNIVVGGAAGAVPVLVGWAAVTSDVAAPAWVLFAIIFVWTPPHFWALAMRYRDDYAEAGVPMLPVVAGTDATTRHILAYSVAVVAVTILLYPTAGMGGLYLAVAVGLGGAFVWRALQLRRDASAAAAMRMFTFSNAYLALLFAAVAVDVLVLPGA